MVRPERQLALMASEWLVGERGESRIEGTE